MIPDEGEWDVAMPSLPTLPSLRVPPPVYLFFGVILLALAYRAFLWEPSVPPPPQANESCKGKPIVVDFPYQGTIEPPHTCQPQCEDGERRYVLYSNGKATQCSPLPNCLDWGEDHGVTCEPPQMTPAV